MCELSVQCVAFSINEVFSLNFMSFASVINIPIKMFYGIVANSFAAVGFAVCELNWKLCALPRTHTVKNLMRSNEANEFYIASNNFIYINHSHVKVYARCCK